jgi:2-polyprenyl-3-methyl-5-hydroxy-6-metoxy-1,4-benzoquinol methylase
MPFDIHHWDNPRAAISTVYKDNDFAYATHGGYAAIFALSFFKNYKISDFKEMTILDFGCGTARMSRTLTPLFKHVYAYDPNKECLKEAEAEAIKANLKPNNLTVTGNFDDIPECDICFSINVMEHLDFPSAEDMLKKLKEKVKYESLIWYSVSKNERNIKKLLSPQRWAEVRAGMAKGSIIQIDLFNLRLT